MKTLSTVFFVIVFALPLFAQEPDPDDEDESEEDTPTVALGVEHLYYCNAGDDVAKIWPLPNGYALGNRRQAINSSFFRDIVLIDPNGLFVDSLSLAKAIGIDFYKVNSVHGVFPLGNGQYYLITYPTVFCLTLTVAGGKLHLLEQPHEETGNYLLKTPKEYQKRFPSLVPQSIGRVGNLVVGYHRTKKAKDGVSRKDIQNFPEFWVAETEKGEVRHIVDINTKEAVATTDLFLGTGRNWIDIPTRTDMFARYYTYADGVLYFNVTRANKCYMYDTNSGQVSFFTFPPVGKGQSCFYFNDAWDGSHWFAKKEQKGEYGIYRIAKGFKGYHKTGTVPLEPRGIYGGKVHVSQRTKEKGRETICHYLLPTSVSPTQKTQVIDTGVTID